MNFYNLFLLFLCSFTGISACESCNEVKKILVSLATEARGYHDAIFQIGEKHYFDQPFSVAFSEGVEKINESLLKISEIFYNIYAFNLTEKKPCRLDSKLFISKGHNIIENLTKIKDDFLGIRTLLKKTNAPKESKLSETVEAYALELSTEDFSEVAFHKIISDFIPDENFTIDLNDFFFKIWPILSVAVEQQTTFFKFLNTNRNLFNSIYSNLDSINTLLKSMNSKKENHVGGLCLKLKEDKKIISSISSLRDFFKGMADNFLKTITILRENCSRVLKSKLEAEIQKGFKKPLLNSDGKHIYFIPGRETLGVIFLDEAENTFYIEKEEEEWDITNDEYKTIKELKILTVERNKIVAPLEFYDFPKPEACYVSYEHVFNDMKRNNEANKDCLKKVHQSFK